MLKLLLIVTALIFTSCGSKTNPATAGGANGQNYYLFVANKGSSDVSAFFASTSSPGNLTSLGRFAATPSPSMVAVDPQFRFLYTGNTASSATSIYSINRNSSSITPNTSTNGIVNPLNFAFHPNGKYLYAADANAGAIKPFSIDSNTGALTALATTNVAAPSSVVVDPSGKYLLDASAGNSSINVFSINSNSGLLSSAGGYGNNAAPNYLMFNTAGTHLYAINTPDASRVITTYSFSNNIGSLALVGTTPTDKNLLAIAIDPLDRFFYQTDTASNKIYIYTISSGGALSAAGFWNGSGSPQSLAMAIEPSGHFLHLINFTSETISTFSIDQTNGNLSPVGSPIGTGSQPNSILIVPGL